MAREIESYEAETAKRRNERLEGVRCSSESMDEYNSGAASIAFFLEK
jgi:hypothetical protein